MSEGAVPDAMCKVLDQYDQFEDIKHSQNPLNLCDVPYTACLMSLKPMPRSFGGMLVPT